MNQEGSIEGRRRRAWLDRWLRIGLISLAAVALGTGVLLLNRGFEAAVLWPSLVAIALAFATREIYTSLLLGAMAGSILLRQAAQGDALLPAFFYGLVDIVSEHLKSSLSSRWNLSILAFTLMMGGLVELLHRNGGMEALAQRMLRSERSSLSPGMKARRAGLNVFAMGWLVFIDGLANSMLVGKTMQSTADRAGLSRQKLAFIVDSTSSPIASFALISTWIVTEMALIREGLENLTDTAAVTVSPYGLLLQSLPYRFYAYFLLVMVFASIWQQRDIGPMLQAERRARRVNDSARAKGEESGHEDTGPVGNVWLTLVPLGVLVVGVFGGLYAEGGGLKQAPSLATAIDAFGRAQADLVFVGASSLAVLAALLLSSLGGKTQTEASKVNWIGAFFVGVRRMLPAAVILVLAWTLNSTVTQLGTANYLVGAIGGHFPSWLLPGAVFVVAALVSFSTGTSWGTMAIVVPLVIPLAVELTGGSGSLLPVAIGAVLAGSVFGDHCSPISDTTLVSAFASGCEPMEHVRTQIPYALSVAAVALALGYIPAAMGASVALLLPAGALACWLLVRVLGRRPETAESVHSSAVS